jgi:hypothetical protein
VSQVANSGIGETEVAVGGRKAFGALAGVIVLGVLGTASTAWAQYDYYDYYWRKRGFVIPCSLVGVNPAVHPDIFGNPAVAREYGFVRARDGRWQVEKNCVRGPYHN